MMIRTYDDKKEASFDLEGLEEYMRTCIDVQGNIKREAVVKAQAYLEGYKDAMYSMANIMGAANYRVKDGEKE